MRADANRRALGLAGLDDADRARHLARLTHNVLAAGRRSEVQALLPEAAEAVRRSGDAAARFTLRLAEGGIRYSEGDYGAALEAIESAGRMAADAGDEPRARIAEQWRSAALGTLDRLEDAMRVSAAGRAAAQRQSQAWAIHLWEQWGGRQLHMLGEHQDAIARLEATFRVGEVRPAFGANDAAALSALAGAALRVGDRRLLRRCEEIARLTLAEGTPELRRHAAWILAQQAMAAGDPVAAHGHLVGLAASLPAEEPVLPFFPVDVADEPQVVRIALAAGDAGLASRAVALAGDRAERNPGVASILGAAHHARGLMDDDLDALRRAVAVYDGGPRRPPLASALEDAGVAALRAGEREASIALLDRALELRAATGARWDVNRLRQRLRHLGVRRRLVVSDRPTRGWGALTPSELAVVRAITGGMTNREAAEALFLSPHTVSSHLRHVFGKLGINSRVELGRMAAQLDDVTA